MDASANPKSEDEFCSATRWGMVARAPGIAEFGSGFPMKPCVKCHDSLEQMKLHARPQSCDEPYRQDH